MGGESLVGARFRGRVIYVPGSPVRVLLGPDGWLRLSGGAAVRLGPGGARRAGAVETLPPSVRWNWVSNRLRLAASAAAGTKGAVLRLELLNPLREPRRLELSVEPSPKGLFRLTSRGKVTTASGRGFKLLLRGAGLGSLGATGRRRHAPFRIEVLLGGGDRKLLELALPAAGFRGEQSALFETAERAERRWLDLRSKMALALLPDETTGRAVEQALWAAAGSVAPCSTALCSMAFHKEGQFPRPGFPAGPPQGTLGAVVLAALELWGGGAVVEGCLQTALLLQSKVPPPGGLEARGFLTAPEAGPGRWISDCGALLWAAALHGRRAGAMWLRRLAPRIEAACRWTASALGASALGLRGTAPGRTRALRAAWNDAWCCLGLEAAGRALVSAGRSSGSEFIALAGSRKKALLSSKGPAGEFLKATAGSQHDFPWRAVLTALLGRGGAGAGLDSLAGSLYHSRARPEEEPYLAAAFLGLLRGSLLREDDEEKRGGLSLLPGAPRRWFAPGSRVCLSRFPVEGGTLDLDVYSSPRSGLLGAELDLARRRGRPGSGKQTCRRVVMKLGPPPGRRLGRLRARGALVRNVRRGRGEVELLTRGPRAVVLEVSR